jgi:putative ABC transport system permease protein
MSKYKKDWSLIQAGVGLAFAAIRGHKLRSFLTVLGVIIGTGTIIGVGSILTGFDGAVTSAIKSFGTDNIIATKWQAGIRFGRRSREEWMRKPLTLDQANAIADRCPNVERVSPYLFPSWGMHRIRHKGNDVVQIQIGGTHASYAQGGQIEMRFGRFFTDFENLHRSPVVAIGEDVYKQLFSGVDPVGKYVEVDGHSFQVVGVMKTPANSFPGQQDLRVILPYYSMRKLMPNAVEHMLMIAAKPGMIAKAMDEVRGVLRQERRLKYSEPDNFGLSTADQMIDDFRQVTAVTVIVMVVLSSVGLLVGGIGVMNIMLVSVVERTREIGIRMATGARMRDIMLQFNIEAAVVCAAGGILGILVGVIAGMVLRWSGMTVVFSVTPAVLAFACASATGLAFGYLPARKAAQLDPVVALASE